MGIALIEKFRSVSSVVWWILAPLFLFCVFAAFWCGGIVASHSYDNRYPVEYSWWTDHAQLHYPGVAISTATANTSCKIRGNVHPPIGENITRLQWLGGRDSIFVGDLKVVYGDEEIIMPLPEVGGCAYVYDAPEQVVVYGQDVTTGEWRQIGKRG